MAKYVMSQKKNLSSSQVLKTLKVLMQGDYTMNELIEILNSHEEEPVFNNSVISKYINTCRYCEIEIPKINSRYYVVKLPFGLDMSVMDIDLLKAIQVYVQDEMSAKKSKLMDCLFAKISRFSNRQMSRVENGNLKYCVEIFERALAKRHKVRLIFKNRDVLEGIPVSISKAGEKTFFNVYNKKIRNIDKSRISGIEVSGQRYVDPFSGEQIVVFKLKGGLAKRYEARINESVELNEDGTITVTNRNENKEMLFSRLLRYDDKCEILSPKGYREDMKDLINDMIKNYEVN